MRWIAFLQPSNKRCDPEWVVMSEETAIQCAKEAHPDSPLSDEQHFEEFCVIHWAYGIDQPEWTK